MAKSKYTVTTVGKKSKISNFAQWGYDTIDLSCEQSQKVLKIVYTLNPKLVTEKGSESI